MSSPPQPDAALPVRERLLRAADELFYAEGITATGVDAVIERAGVATGSLYKNFGGKDGLVRAYLQDREDRWLAHWEACIAEEREPRERLLALFTALERWARLTPSRGCAHLAATVQVPAGHPTAEAAREHKLGLVRRLRELCEETGVPDPDDLCHDLLVIYEGTQNVLALGLDPDPTGRARRLAALRIDHTPRS